DHETVPNLPALKQSAGFEHYIPSQSPIHTVEVRGSTEAREHAAHRVPCLTGINDVQRYGPRHVPNGQVARHLVVVVRRALDAGALERDGRELLDVQEVG